MAGMIRVTREKKVSKKNPTFLQRLGLSIYVYGLEHPTLSVRELGDAFGCIDVPGGDSYAVQLLKRARQVWDVPSYNPGPTFCKASVDAGRRAFQELEAEYGPIKMIAPKFPVNPSNDDSSNHPINPNIMELNQLIHARDSLMNDLDVASEAHANAAKQTADAYNTYRELGETEAVLFEQYESAKNALARHIDLIDTQLAKIREALST